MADRRRTVGKRQRTSDNRESRIDALRRRLEALRDDDTPQGVDARTVGDDRSAVDARRVDVDDEISAASGSEARSRVAAAKERATDELQDRVNKESLTAAAKESIRSLASDEGAPNRAPGTTGTQTEEIAKRATDAAAIRAPMGGSLRTVGDERIVTDMARAGAAEGAGMLAGAPLDFQGSGDRQRREASAPIYSDDGGWGAEDQPDKDSNIGFEDPFGLTGGASESDSGGEEEMAFPAINLLGGED